jgi:hypothetical protein
MICTQGKAAGEGGWGRVGCGPACRSRQSASAYLLPWCPVHGFPRAEGWWASFANPQILRGGGSLAICV